MSEHITKPENILPRNIGIDWTRAAKDHTPGGQINLEKIFMEEWDKENGDVKWLNKGIGIAQLLMIISEKNAELYDGPDQEGNQYHLFDFFMNGPEVCIYDLTEREQRIIATIIQWLGTNVGFSFLRRCFQRAGYMIKEVPNPSSKPVKPLGLKGRFRILRET